jgi:hypothetical protein
MLTAMAAAAISEAVSSTPSYRYVVYLQVEKDCVTLNNPKTGGPTRDRTYQAYDQFGDPIVATITERVLAATGGLSTLTDSPTSSSSTGRFSDQVGLLNSSLQVGTFNAYQYFVTTIPGTPWVNVPTEIRSAAGVNMVLGVTMSHWYEGGKNIFDVKYNGDAGMGGLPICGK